MRNLLLAALATAGLVGCVGGIETTQPPVPTQPPPGSVGDPGTGDSAAAAAARTAFETDVYPIVSATGRCIGCHNSTGPSGNLTGFVAPKATDAYVTITGYAALMGNYTAAGAPILTKVAGGHYNMTYSQTEKDKITNWLSKELAARTGGGGGSGSGNTNTVARLVAEWQGCMTLANFTQAGMTAFGTMRADNSQCKTCHNTGAYGEVADDTAGPFFQKLQTDSGYLAQYFTVDMSQGAAAAKVVVNTKSFIGVGQNLAPHFSHPRFNFTGSAGETALNKFYNLTLAAKTAGTCAPPK